MSDLFPNRLLNVSHYRQPHGRHPVPRRIPAGETLVELVTGGRGYVEQDGLWAEVLTGTLLWHSSGCYTIGRSDFQSPYRCLAVLFSTPDGAPALPRISRWDEPAEISQFTRDAVSHFLDEAFDRDALLAHLYGRLFYQVRLYHHRAPAADAPAALAMVLEAVNSRYSQPLQIQDLAEMAGWSVPYLHAMFRLHLDTSPHQALIRRRLRAVREQLATSHRPLKQIADECGFSTAAALCRAFRQATGMTPAVFRRQRMQPWAATATVENVQLPASGSRVATHKFKARSDHDVEP